MKTRRRIPIITHREAEEYYRVELRRSLVRIWRHLGVLHRRKGKGRNK